MDMLKTLRVTAAATVLGALGLASAGDINTERVVTAATKENRSLTESEMKQVTGPHPSLYLAAGSIPAWLALRCIDEKKEKK